MANKQEQSFAIIVLLIVFGLAANTVGDTLDSIFGDMPYLVQGVIVLIFGWTGWLLLVWLGSLINKK